MIKKIFLKLSLENVLTKKNNISEYQSIWNCLQGSDIHSLRIYLYNNYLCKTFIESNVQSYYLLGYFSQYSKQRLIIVWLKRLILLNLNKIFLWNLNFYIKNTKTDPIYTTSKLILHFLNVATSCTNGKKLIYPKLRAKTLRTFN